VAGFVLVAVLGTLVAVGASDREVITPAAPRTTSETLPDMRADAASRLLLDLTNALEDGSRRDAVSLAAPGQPEARRGLGVIYDNVRRLGVTDLSMRFVDEEAGKIDQAERRTLGPKAWVADVALGWKVRGYDSRKANMEVSFALVDTPEGAAFASAADDFGNPAPLWLLDRLAVSRSKRALVAAVNRQQLGRYTALANEAVRDVRRVLPQWRGRLVVEVPATQDELDRMLDAQPDAYAKIAAVTATVDGSMSPSAPVHIMVNPKIYGGLGDQGGQIVMSHEATHVAMNAATSTMPLWLLEGFADYVALARSDLPVSVTASQILGEVRRSGPPDALPGAHEFDPANKLLGTSYEAAWLACRLLAQTYGEGELISFYKSVDSGTSIDKAFAGLGTTEARFTQKWRAYLRELAG
jgi:hypothetical protein